MLIICVWDIHASQIVHHVYCSILDLPTQHVRQQKIRNAVLLRKLIFGSMTTSGKLNIALAMTIIRTATQRALDPIKILREIAIKGTTDELLESFGLPVTMPQAP